MTLTPKQARFVEEYIVDLNATRAAERAGYSAKTANEQGSRLLAHASVRAAVNAAKQKRSARTEISADKVLQDLAAIAFADARTLVEHRRRCCRFCYGIGHRRQFTENEQAARLENHNQQIAALAAKQADAGDDEVIPDLGPFDEMGGTGYDARRDPFAECPECFGEGVSDVFIPDTRKLTPEQARLFAGVKQTKDGIEVLTRSQDSALERLGKHLKLFTDKLEISGVDALAEKIAKARSRKAP